MVFHCINITKCVHFISNRRGSSLQFLMETLVLSLGAAVHVFLQGLCSGVELLDHRVCLALVLQDNVKIFSKW